MDTSKYIGIPHIFAQSSHDGCDCVGLVRLVYSENHWQPDCYDGEFSKDWYIKEPLRLVKYLMRHWDMTKDISELSPGDVCYFQIGGEGHVGLWLPYNNLLTTFPGGTKQWDGSVLPNTSMVIHKDQWIHGFRAGFKRRK